MQATYSYGIGRWGKRAEEEGKFAINSQVQALSEQEARKKLVKVLRRQGIRTKPVLRAEEIGER